MGVRRELAIAPCHNILIKLSFPFVIKEQLTDSIILFQGTTQWLDIYLTYDVSTTLSLVPTWHHSYDDMIDDVPRAVLHVPVTVFITGSLYLSFPLPLSKNMAYVHL